MSLLSFLQLLSLSDLATSGATLKAVGGKAFQLGSLLDIEARSTEATFTVPRGCVVTTACFHAHLDGPLGTLAVEVPAGTGSAALASIRSTVRRHLSCFFW